MRSRTWCSIEAIYEKFATRVDGRLSILTGRTDDDTGVVTATAIEGPATPIHSVGISRAGDPDVAARGRGVARRVPPEVSSRAAASGFSARTGPGVGRKRGIPVLGWGLGR